MKILALAAIAAALGFPVQAQQPASLADEKRAAKAATAPPPAPEGRTPREKARLAKEANKDARCASAKPKKATAT